MQHGDSIQIPLSDSTPWDCINDFCHYINDLTTDGNNNFLISKSVWTQQKCPRWHVSYIVKVIHHSSTTALQTPGLLGLLLRGLRVPWEYPAFPKAFQTAQDICILAAKCHLHQWRLQSCTAHLCGISLWGAPLPSRLCWLPWFCLFWLKWEHWVPACQQMLGAFSIPPLAIRQSRLDELVVSCRAQQHVCPISRQVCTQSFVDMTLPMIIAWFRCVSSHHSVSCSSKTEYMLNHTKRPQTHIVKFPGVIIPGKNQEKIQ